MFVISGCFFPAIKRQLLRHSAVVWKGYFRTLLPLLYNFLYFSKVIATAAREYVGNFESSSFLHLFLNIFSPALELCFAWSYSD